MDITNSGRRRLILLKSLNLTRFLSLNFLFCIFYSYETDNGITAQETGDLKQGRTTAEAAEEVKGQYSYTAPDGQIISLSYVADETGFHPVVWIWIWFPYEFDDSLIDFLFHF